MIALNRADYTDGLAVANTSSGAAFYADRSARRRRIDCWSTREEIAEHAIGQAPDMPTRDRRISYGLILLSHRLGGWHMLCVQQYVSYAFREVMYRLLRLSSLSSSHLQPAIDCVCRLISSLSPREFGIILSPAHFEEEVVRAYSDGRERLIRGVMAGYWRVYPLLRQSHSLHPDPSTYERRWSPPKGAAVADDKTQLDTITREVWEETGLCPDQYAIIDADHPLVYDYSVDRIRPCQAATATTTATTATTAATATTADSGFSFRQVLYLACLTTQSTASVAPPVAPPAASLAEPSEGLHPHASNEIARAAFIPLTDLTDYLPLEYGLQLQSHVKSLLTSICR